MGPHHPLRPPPPLLSSALPRDQSSSQPVGTAQHCAALHFAALHCAALHFAARHCAALRCTALHCTALHCAARHCTVRCAALRSLPRCSAPRALTGTDCAFCRGSAGPAGTCAHRSSRRRVWWRTSATRCASSTTLYDCRAALRGMTRARRRGRRPIRTAWARGWSCHSLDAVGNRPKRQLRPSCAVHDRTFSRLHGTQFSLQQVTISPTCRYRSHLHQACWGGVCLDLMAATVCSFSRSCRCRRRETRAPLPSASTVPHAVAVIAQLIAV